MVKFRLLEVNFRHLVDFGTRAAHFRTLGIEVKFRHLGVDFGTFAVHFRTLEIEKGMCVNEKTCRIVMIFLVE